MRGREHEGLAKPGKGIGRTVQPEQRLEVFEAKEGAQIGFLYAGTPSPDGHGPRTPVGPVWALVVVFVFEVRVMKASRRGDVRVVIGAQRSMASPVTRGTSISNLQWQCQRNYPGKRTEKILTDVRPLGGAVGLQILSFGWN